MNLNSIKLRLSIALILSVGFVIALTGVGFHFLSPEGDEVKLNAIEFMSILSVFFLLILIILFLSFPLIFRPIRKLARQVRECRQHRDFSNLRPEKYPELKDLMVATSDVLEYNEKEMNLAEMIKSVSKQRAELAETDRMTELYNKNYLMNYLGAEMLRTKTLGDEISVIMFDIDNFKFYNDTNGHPAGDEVLIKLAQILKTNTREMDLCVRYGGEEFLIVLPKTPLLRAERLAERIRNSIEKASFPQEEKQPGGALTVSVGVANFPNHASTGEQLIAKADEALYVAKRKGKNFVCIYDRAMPSPEEPSETQEKAPETETSDTTV